MRRHTIDRKLAQLPPPETVLECATCKRELVLDCDQAGTQTPTCCGLPMRDRDLPRGLAVPEHTFLFATNAAGDPTDWESLPKRMRVQMDRWLVFGAEPLSYLSAIIRNDLLASVRYGDDRGQAVPQVLRFLEVQAPPASWGSEAKADAWQAARRAGEGA